MKKLLIGAAICILAATGSASAGPKATTISLDNVCDVLTIARNKILKTAVVLKEDNPECEGLYGAGFIGKVKTFGNVAVIGLRGGLVADEEYVLKLSYPFVTGGSYILYGTADGVNLIGFAGGTYTVNGAPVRGAKPVTAQTQ